MTQYLTPELEPNELGLKLKSKAVFVEEEEKEEKEKTKETPSQVAQSTEVKPEPKQSVLPQKEKVVESSKPTSVIEKSKTHQLLDFVLLSGIIFVVIFLAVNFSAYKEIATNYFAPEKQQEKSDNLKKAVGKKNIEQILISVDNSKKHVKKTFPALSLTITPPDNRIVIPKIGQNIPLVEMDTNNLTGQNWKELEDQIQDGLRKGVVHYPGTAIPGQIGNVFVTGHSSYYPWDKGEYKEVFALLPKMETEDLYYIFYNQKKYTYRIREKKEVYPNNVDVLNQPDNEKISTLMTCVPVGTALRRLILVAEEVM